MATSSLSNMTVPIANNGDTVSQGLLMPKLAYRFRVTFLNFGINANVTELTKQVMKFDRPHVQFEEIKLPVYNSTIKIAGKYSWNDVTCDIRDDSAGNISNLVGQQLQKQLDFMEQSSAAAGINYKFLTQFEILDGGNGTNTPTVLETWELYGCQISQVDYGELNYGTSEAAMIALTVRFDNAVQTPTGTGIGTAVGRTLGTLTTG